MKEIVLLNGMLFLTLLGTVTYTPLLQAADSGTVSRQANTPSNQNAANAKALTQELDKQLEGLPQWVGWIFLVAGFIPLFWGWRFLRTVVSIFCAILCARIAYTLAAPHLGSLGALVASMVASMVGGSLGWHVRAMLISVEGAIVLGASLFTLGAYVGSADLAMGLGAFGAVTGLYLGFKYAPYLEAIEAALIGATLVGMGVAVLRPGSSPDQTTYCVVGAALIAAAASTYYQFKHIPDWISSGKLEPQPARRTR